MIVNFRRADDAVLLLKELLYFWLHDIEGDYVDVVNAALNELTSQVVFGHVIDLLKEMGTLVENANGSFSPSSQASLLAMKQEEEDEAARRAWEAKETLD